MQISFGNALAVISDTNDITKWNDPRIDKTTFETIGTIKNLESSIYDQKTSRQIGSFLRAATGDYSAKTGHLLRKIQGDIYLFTGEEAKQARKIIHQSKKEAEELERRYAEGPNEDTPRTERIELESEELHKINRQNISIRRDRKLLEIVGKEFPSKGLSSILLVSDQDKKVNLCMYTNGNTKQTKTLTI